MKLKQYTIAIATSLVLSACCGKEGTDITMYITNGDTVEIGVFGELYNESFSFESVEPGETVESYAHVDSEEVLMPQVDSEFECYYYTATDTADISQLNKYAEHKGQEGCYKFVTYSILLW